MKTLLCENLAAEMLAISVRKLQNLVRAGQVPHVEFPDGDIRFDEEDLAGWVASRRKGKLPEAACRMV